MSGFPFLSHSLHIDGVMLTASAERDGSVAGDKADVALAQVLEGERHPHTQCLACRQSIGIYIERESDGDFSPVAYAVYVGRAPHCLEEILVITSVAIVLALGSGRELIAEEPQIANSLAEPPFTAIDIHNFELALGFPCGNLRVGDIGHTLLYHFASLLWSDIKVLANTRHYLVERVDFHGIGLPHHFRE